MLKLYPDRSLGALVRVTADALALLWIVFWGLAGYLIYQTVMSLEVIADGIANTGKTFNSWIQAFRNAVPRGIPGLSNWLIDQANALQKHSGDQLIITGGQVHQGIQETALILALLTALPPILMVALAYGLWRLRDMQEMGAALAFVRIAHLTGRAEQARAVLAYRAVTTLSWRDLMRASSDPVGDLAEHDYDRLAAAMLKRAGLDPFRLPGREVPKLGPARGASRTQASKRARV